MADNIGLTSQQFTTGALDAQAKKLLKSTHDIALKSSPGAKQDAKIEKSAKDFESILLGSWLQQAEQSFAKVPGGADDSDDDSADAGKDQFQGIAMQALAGSLTASGGIGIAKMISSHLHRQADGEDKGVSTLKNATEATGSPVPTGEVAKLPAR